MSDEKVKKFEKKGKVKAFLCGSARILKEVNERDPDFKPFVKLIGGATIALGGSLSGVAPVGIAGLIVMVDGASQIMFRKNILGHAKDSIKSGGEIVKSVGNGINQIITKGREDR